MPQNSFQHAYQAAEYHVYTDAETIILRIDQHNPAFDQLLDKHQALSGCFITAYNPHSQQLEEALNRKTQVDLEHALVALSCTIYAGAGIDPKGLWPQEPSFLALDLPPTTAHELAQQFQQNAYVWIDYGQAPRLIWVSD